MYTFITHLSESMVELSSVAGACVAKPRGKESGRVSRLVSAVFISATLLGLSPTSFLSPACSLGGPWLLLEPFSFLFFCFSTTEP